MTTVDVQLDYDGLGRMLKAPWMVAAMAARAEKGLVVAHAVASEHNDTGEFAASLSHGATRDGGARHDRAEGWVKSTDPHALSKELGHLSGSRGDVDRRPVEGIHALGSGLAAIS